MAIEYSIIITTYNYEKYLPRAIRSCMEQSLERNLFEIIVVDDASTDGTDIVIESFNRYIKRVKHKTNRGLAAARNSGLAVAQGTWISFLDADDLLHRDFLRIMKLNCEFNQEMSDAFACDYFLVDDNANHLRRVNVESTPIACGVMYKKTDLLSIGLFDERLHIGEDVDMRVRFCQHFSIGRVNLPLYRYRMHDENLTRNESVNKQYIELVQQKHKSLEINAQYWRSKLSNKDEE